MYVRRRAATPPRPAPELLLRNEGAARVVLGGNERAESVRSDFHEALAHGFQPDVREAASCT